MVSANSSPNHHARRWPRRQMNDTERQGLTDAYSACADKALLTALTTERSQYRPEVLPLMEAEVRKRNLPIPPPPCALTAPTPKPRSKVDQKREKGWLTGVCATIANRFTWNVFVVRAVATVATILTGGVFGVVIYAICSQFIRTPDAKYGRAFKTASFWLLITFWCSIPILFIIYPLMLFGVINSEEGAGVMTALGMVNGTSLPVILVVFCITRIVRWRKRRTHPPCN